MCRYVSNYGLRVIQFVNFMKQSQLFGKTLKEVPKDEVSNNAIFLIRGGFINKVMAGVYTYLPLGLRVLTKIEHIIRQEMDMVATEILMPSIVPRSIWEQTGRIDTVDVLMKTSPANQVSADKNSSEYILNPTHEDVVTPLAQNYFKSYKDFPFAVYQIQTKFRNEPRAKSGLLRCREFRMKDLYSFHRSEQELLDFYEQMKDVYTRVFEKLGLGDDTRITLASGGDFTKEFSHEFQTKCETGEDIVFYASSIDTAYNKEIAPSNVGNQPNITTELKEREDVLGEGLIGVDALADYLQIPVEQTTKTILFEADNNRIIAAAVRGDYEINELKLKKILGVKELHLASEDTVRRVTGAEVGYAGLLNLPDDVEVFMDDSMKGRTNFEMGANQTNYHSININFGRDLPEPEIFYDFKIAQEGDIHPETGETYEVYKASEVGNIFPLNTKFTDSCSYTFQDQDGTMKPIYMGSYGIGPSRIMGVLVEKFHDEQGILWPEAVAPYKVHLVCLGSDDKVVKEADNLYKQLISMEVEVLYDDRDVSIGAKLADSDLIGLPYRIVISNRTLEKNSVEFKKRSSKDVMYISVDECFNKLK